MNDRDAFFGSTRHAILVIAITVGVVGALHAASALNRRPGSSRRGDLVNPHAPGSAVAVQLRGDTGDHAGGGAAGSDHDGDSAHGILRAAVGPQVRHGGVVLTAPVRGTPWRAMCPHGGYAYEVRGVARVVCYQ